MLDKEPKVPFGVDAKVFGLEGPNAIYNGMIGIVISQVYEGKVEIKANGGWYSFPVKNLVRVRQVTSWEEVPW